MGLQVKTNTGISLVKDILTSKTNVTVLEMKLSISETLSKPLINKIFDGQEDIAFTFITSIVKRFADSFGFSTKMTETQIELLTVDTLTHFSHESAEDIILFFSMARSGKFGTTKRGVDSNLIFGEWFPMYLELKSIEREKENEKIKKEASAYQRGVSLESIYKKKLKYLEIKKKNDFENKVKAHIEHICKTFDRQILEDTIIDWLKDEQKKDWVHLLKLKRKVIK